MEKGRQMFFMNIASHFIHKTSTYKSFGCLHAQRDENSMARVQEFVMLLAQVEEVKLIDKINSGKADFLSLQFFTEHNPSNSMSATASPRHYSNADNKIFEPKH